MVDIKPLQLLIVLFNYLTRGQVNNIDLVKINSDGKIKEALPKISSKKIHQERR